MSRTSHHFQLPRSSLIFSGLASPPSQDFTYFSKLPIETRLRIWRYGLPGPRILDFLPAQEDVPKRWEFLFAQRHEGAVLLTLLAVNHESRTEALKYYTIIQQPRGYSVAFALNGIRSTSTVLLWDALGYNSEPFLAATKIANLYMETR
jgi:hypothetical protein